jgi:hypothetical protein
VCQPEAESTPKGPFRAGLLVEMEGLRIVLPRKIDDGRAGEMVAAKRDDPADLQFVEIEADHGWRSFMN